MVTSDFLTGSRNIGVSRMCNKKVCNLALSYGRIAKIAAHFSHGPVNSAMGQIPCSTERISNLLVTFFDSISKPTADTAEPILTRDGSYDVSS